MAKTVFNVTFVGDVFTLHVYLGDHEVPMVQQDDTWSGTQTIDVVGDTILLEFRFVAPPGTDWTIALDSTTNLLKDKGTSKAARFSYSKSVPTGKGGANAQSAASLKPASRRGQ